MKKNQNLKNIFFIILLQSAIGILVGLIVLLAYFTYFIPSGLSILNENIGSQSYTQASNTLQKIYESKISKMQFTISMKGIKEFKIPLASICQSKIGNLSLVDFYENNPITALIAALPNEFGRTKKYVNIPLKIDDKRLSSFINDFSIIANKQSKNARLDIVDDKIKIVNSQNGFSVNKLKLKNSVISALKYDDNLHFTLDPEKSEQFETNSPEISTSELWKYNEIKAKFSINSQKNNKSSLEKIIFKIDGTIIKNQFSMLNFISRSGLKYIEDAEVNFVSSAIFASLLESGVSPQSIQRFTHEETQDYIKPGLDVLISENEKKDFTVSNTTGNNLMIKLINNDNLFSVYIIGDRNNNTKLKKLEFVEQRITPGFINVEDKDMQNGTKKVITPGKDGMTVWVYVLDRDLEDKKSESPSYVVNYQPVETIVQVGPNTKWTPNVK